jgi:plastocyanin
MVAGLLVAGCAGQQAPDIAQARTPPRPIQPVVSSLQASAGKPVDEERLDLPGDSEASVSAHKVSIDSFTFHPETLVVPAGATVVWVNADDVPHTVRSTEDLFRSGTLDSDDVYERRFVEPGTFEYYCGVHRHMTGKIVVK